MKEPYNTIVGFIFLVLAMAFAYYTTKEVEAMKKNKNRDQGLDSAPRFLVYYVCRMKKVFKFITELTNKVGVSLTLPLGSGTENPLVMGEADKVGLIAVLGSTPLMWPINLGLNFTKFNEVKKV